MSENSDTCVSLHRVSETNRWNYINIFYKIMCIMIEDLRSESPLAGFLYAWLALYILK